MNSINIGVFGPAGRMGQDVIQQLKNFNSFELSYLCEKKGHRSVGKRIFEMQVEDNIDELIKKSDVIIDFTIPLATINLLEKMNKVKNPPALVTGTTGYSRSEEKKFYSLLKGKTILRSFNMSIGVNLLKKIVSFTAKNIGHKSDIEILEVHHNKKKDIPSGTALSLADSVTEGNTNIKKYSYREKNNNNVRRKNEIGFASIRGGDVVGEHSVFFFLDGEQIELKHIASDRKIFSMGAIEAARWLHKRKPGLYTIMDMVDS